MFGIGFSVTNIKTAINRGSFFSLFSFIAAYKGTDSTQNINSDGNICNLMPKGTVTATSVHSTPILAPDYLGVYREYPIDGPVWKGGRSDLNPDKLFWECHVSVTTPIALTNFRISCLDGSTHREKYTGIGGNYSIGDTIASGENAAYRPTDHSTISVYTGNLTEITYIYIYNLKLTGELPELLDCPLCVTCYMYDNLLTGDMPDISNNTSINRLYIYSNEITGYKGGWPAKAFSLRAENNKLTEEAVNLILTEADTYGIHVGTTINLTGGTNAAPTGAGITAKANLIANGATVTTN